MSNTETIENFLLLASKEMDRAENTMVHCKDPTFKSVKGQMLLRVARNLGEASVYNSLAITANGHKIEGDIEKSLTRSENLWSSVTSE